MKDESQAIYVLMESCGLEWLYQGPLAIVFKKALLDEGDTEKRCSWRDQIVARWILFVGWHAIIYMLWFDIAQNSTYSPYLDTLRLSSANNQKFA